MSLIGADTFEWDLNAKGDYILYKIPRNIRYNDNVVVKEDEYAVFFRDGKAMHVFSRPGRYALTTQNIPILATLVKAVSGVEQVGEIYYLQKREMRGKFGTKEPLTFRDKDFGLVRIRIFGKFSYKVRDPMVLITQFVGMRGYSHNDEIVEWMKDQVVMNLNDILGELKRDKGMGVADMPAYLEELEQIVVGRLKDEGSRYGIEIMKVIGININLPQEVQDAVDARSSMGVLGTSYMEYQTAQAIRDLPGSGGGAGDTAAAGMGLGAGVGMGMMVPGMMQQGGMSGVPSVPGEAAKCPSCGAKVLTDSKFCRECGAVLKAMATCPKCKAAVPEDSRFCKECGATISTAPRCPVCGAALDENSRFCKECGARASAGGKKVCAKCSAELAPDAKFCDKCGEKAE